MQDQPNQEVRNTQVRPVAGIWLCPNCGRRIQVITDSDVPKRQSFVCVCGTSMEPGEEHTQVARDPETDESYGSAVDA
jgi:hypothetical protein